MRRLNLLSLLLAAVMLVGLTAPAAAENELFTLMDVIDALLFYTDNVTVTGTADFTMDGKNFKSVEVTYMQDGVNSYWDLKTVTPKADGTERDGGYTIIANGEDIYVMEVFYPGAYKHACDEPQSSLVRETALLGPMMSFARILSDEITLPMTVTKTAAGTEMRLAMADQEVPLLMDAAVNVAARYIAGRYFGTGMDRRTDYMKDFTWDSYITPTQALVNTTEYLNLNAFDVTFVLNDQTDLTSVNGFVQVDAVDFAGTSRALKATFSISVGAYGSTHVRTFDPADYDVVPFIEYINAAPEGGWDELDPIDDSFVETAGSLAVAMGFTLEQPVVNTYRNDGYIVINLYDGENDLMFCLLEDHTAGMTYNLNNPVLLWDAEIEPVTGVSDETLAEAERVLAAFTAKASPVSAESYTTVKPVGMVRDAAGELFLYFEDGDGAGISWIVKAEPEWTVEAFKHESAG